MKWKSLSNLRLFWFNLDGPGRFRTGVKKAYFRTCYFNADNKEQFVSQRMTVTVNDSESNDRIQFKIIHLKSKKIREENFDATEKLWDLQWCSISYNSLKSIDFDNASFIIDCFTYILFNLNLYFLERKFDYESEREYVKMMWNYLVPNEFYIYVCRNDLIVLNKLSLKYQNAFDIVNIVILEKSNNFVLPKDFFTSIQIFFQNTFEE